MKKFRNPQNVHKPLAAYSHQIEVSASERLLIMSGQIGMQEDGTVPTDTIEQLQVTLENINRNLTAAGMMIKDILKLTIYVVGQMDAAERRKVLADFFKDIEPCMTLLFVAALGAPSLKVEIDVMASKEDQK